MSQFGRKINLVLVDGQNGLDLSQFRFTFQTRQCDTESPNNCFIRIYNLSETTVKQIRGQYSRVVLQAGYEDNFGVIFDGQIKQFGMGREGATDAYLDIMAADGDQAYNYSVVRQTLARENSAPADQHRTLISAMADAGAKQGYTMDFTGGILPRGKVLFGLARARMRELAVQQRATWSIANGKVTVTALEGYKPGEALVLNSATGMIGIPEQTEQGLMVKCLLNPRLDSGSLVRINNRDVNQVFQQNPGSAPVPYNKYVGLQLLATITNDGLYRVFVAEHSGDTRGTEFYTNIILLAVADDTKKVKSL